MSQNHPKISSSISFILFVLVFVNEKINASDLRLDAGLAGHFSELTNFDENAISKEPVYSMPHLDLFFSIGSKHKLLGGFGFSGKEFGEKITIGYSELLYGYFFGERIQFGPIVGVFGDKFLFREPFNPEGFNYQLEGPCIGLFSSYNHNLFFLKRVNASYLGRFSFSSDSGIYGYLLQKTRLAFSFWDTSPLISFHYTKVYKEKSYSINEFGVAINVASLPKRHKFFHDMNSGYLFWLSTGLSVASLIVFSSISALD